MESHQRWPRLDRQLLLRGCLSAPTRMPQWLGPGDVASRRRSHLSLRIVQGAVLARCVMEVSARRFRPLQLMWLEGCGRFRESRRNSFCVGCGSDTSLRGPELRQSMRADRNRMTGDRRSLGLEGKEGRAIAGGGDPGGWPCPINIYDRLLACLLTPWISLSPQPEGSGSLYPLLTFALCVIPWPSWTWIPLTSFNPRARQTSRAIGGIQRRTTAFPLPVESVKPPRLWNQATNRARGSKTTA